MSITKPTEFPEIERVTLRDRVMTAIKDSFFSGLLEPGDRIVERQIAQRMGIGTPAVREALIALEQQGFVRRVTNTATYVTKYTIEEVEQLYSLRVELELLALQWAKPRHAEKDLQILEQTVLGMIDSANLGQARKFFELDLQFHRHCWQLCGNKYLADTLERLVSPLFAFVLVSGGLPVTQVVAEEHGNIVSALRNLEEPRFSIAVRSSLAGFRSHGLRIMAHQVPVRPVEDPL